VDRLCDAGLVNEASPTKIRKGLWWFQPGWSYLPVAQQTTAFMDKKGFWLYCILLPYLGFVAGFILLGRWMPELWREDVVRVLGGGAASIIAFIVALKYVVVRMPPLVNIDKTGIYNGGRLARRESLILFPAAVVEERR
jgi:hypothetical protein